MEEQRLGFLQRLVIAVAKPKEYWKVVQQGSGRAIGFLAIFLIFTTFCGFPLDYIKLSISTHGFQDFVDDDIPEFELANGRLEMEDTYLVDEDKVYVFADTTYEEFSYEDVEQIVENGNYESVIFIGATNVFTYSNGEYKEFNFADYGSLTFSRDSLRGIMKLVNVFGAIGIVILYGGVLLWYLVMACIYAVFGLIIKNILGIGTEVNFGHLFLMSLSAKVTMRIVLAICKLFDVTIPYFNWICFAVTLVYLFFGLLGIKEKREQDGTIEQNYR